MKIWAHRGCSQRYPENTITSFTKAAELFERGLVGIELDIQLTQDGHIVVIHDERIDRTTDGYGLVRDYTLEELRNFHIHTGTKEPEHIPTIEEVLDLLEDRMQKGFKLNIELKNSVYPYPGMEEKMIDIVRDRGLEDSIVWSSFWAKSLSKVRRILSDAEIGILDSKASDCLYKLKGGCGANAIHPYWQGIDVTVDDLYNAVESRNSLGYVDTGDNREDRLTVRAWFSGHLYPEKPTGGRLDLEALEEKGITDVFLNEPEVYLV